MPKETEQYSKPEAQRRFLNALKAAVTTPPKPLKDKPKATGESRGRPAKRKRA